MSGNDAFGLFSEEDIYSFKKTGSFGRFTTIHSFPIEFFLTSLKASELHNLTFARDIKPGKKIDFDQLLQRDLDLVRVETEIKPYLTNAESKSRTVFFPPLLVAAIPVCKNTMEEYYSDQSVTKISLGNREGHIRKWDGLFKLTHAIDDNYTISPSMANIKHVIGVAREPTQIEVKLSNGVERGIKLIVIDGQHRLKALQEVYTESADLLSEMAVPLCILFSPNSTNEVADILEKEGYTIPRVPEIFRQLFVDVNKNAEQVGGHFNILLSEGNMGSLICRTFCSYVLEKRGIDGLAQIEWNQKKKKLSTEINRSYYLTSIGVIEKALSETFGKNKFANEYLIGFEDIKEMVQPSDSDDHLEYPKVSWDKFSLSQKKYILDQIKTNVVPLLDKLFFESNLFKPATDCFNKEISKLKEKSDSDTQSSIAFKPVLENLLEYMPIPESDRYREARHNLRVFEEDIKNCKKGQCFSFLNHAIFQRALFVVWNEILKIGKRVGVPKEFANSYYFNLIDELDNRVDDLIDFKKGYCQSFIFSSNRINPTNEVKNGLSYLILSIVSNQKTRERLSASISHLLSDKIVDSFNEELRNLAYSCLNKYMQSYRKNKIKVIKTNYSIDSSIDDELRNLLQEEESKKKREMKDYKDGIISKEQLTSNFDSLIAEFVENDINNVQYELRKALNLELDVFGLNDISPELSEDTSEFEQSEE
ncbi:DNA sulfur modification protein DndB [Enterobacter hormaechei]